MRPRIRTIKPEFFSDPEMQTISVGSRYIAIGLMSAADDRGRLQRMIPQLRGYVFPNGDITERQFERALDDIEGIKFTWCYMVGSFTYLWLPRFWRHQRINRPTESPLPPHPRDPYGGLPVEAAMSQFKEDSLNGHDPLTEDSVINHGSLTPSRAGARSDPIPDPLVVHLTDQLAARVRANDPKAHPDPQSSRWLTDMRLLLADRDGDAAEVERVIDWCQADSFWRSNILSPGKLRKQFTALLLRSQESNVSPISAARRPNAGDLIEEIQATQAAGAGSAA